MSKHAKTNSWSGPDRQKRIKKYFLYGLLLFAVFTIGQVWQNVSIDQTIRRNQKLKNDLKQMQYESYLLTLQYESLANVERIERLAKEKLGFVQAVKFNIDMKSIDE